MKCKVFSDKTILSENGKIINEGDISERISTFLQGRKFGFATQSSEPIAGSDSVYVNQTETTIVITKYAIYYEE
ncbi:hypothetical protein KKA24_00165 [Patescibacteria group bacterium]|nr:hypothetical protein [Patescibacteria group bacterium]